MTDLPDNHVLADALHLLGDLAAVGRVWGNRIAADPWIAERIVAALTHVDVFPDLRPPEWHGYLLGGHVVVIAIPTASQLAAEQRTPDRVMDR